MPASAERCSTEPPPELFVHEHALTGAPSPRGPVTHAHATLVLCTRGTLSAWLGADWTVREGDALLIPAGAPHRSVRAASEANVRALGLCPACLVAQGLGELLAPFEQVLRGASPVVTLPGERWAHVHTLVDELARELSRPSPSELAQRSLVALALTEVARAHGPAARAHEDPSSTVVADALRFIEQKCLGPLSARDVALAVRRSPAYLTTLLRERTGRSTGEWITEGRMSEARRRLARGDEQVSIIAERVGYADATHFIRLFRRLHGRTPAAFRAAERRAPPPARA